MFVNRAFSAFLREKVSICWLSVFPHSRHVWHRPGLQNGKRASSVEVLLSLLIAAMTVQRVMVEHIVQTFHESRMPANSTSVFAGPDIRQASRRRSSSSFIDL